MKSWIVHYKNKYPGAKVQSSESALDVYLGDHHVVALRKDGAGGWADHSEEMGCRDRHDLAPIPKDARVHKVVDGKVGFDELAEERKQKCRRFVKDGRVLSCDELKKHGFQFDEKQRVVAEPQAKSADVTQPIAQPAAGNGLSL